MSKKRKKQKSIKRATSLSVVQGGRVVALRITGWCMAAFSFLGILLAARRAGRNAERVDTLKKTLKSVEEANAIRREVADDHRNGTVPKRVRKFYID